MIEIQVLCDRAFQGENWQHDENLVFKTNWKSVSTAIKIRSQAAKLVCNNFLFKYVQLDVGYFFTFYRSLHTRSVGLKPTTSSSTLFKQREETTLSYSSLAWMFDTYRKIALKHQVKWTQKLTSKHEKPSATQALHPKHKVAEFSSHKHQNLLQWTYTC